VNDQKEVGTRDIEIKKFVNKHSFIWGSTMEKHLTGAFYTAELIIRSTWRND